MPGVQDQLDLLLDTRSRGSLSPWPFAIAIESLPKLLELSSSLTDFVSECLPLRVKERLVEGAENGSLHSEDDLPGPIRPDSG